LITAVNAIRLGRKINFQERIESMKKIAALWMLVLFAACGGSSSDQAGLAADGSADTASSLARDGAAKKAPTGADGAYTFDAQIAVGPAFTNSCFKAAEASCGGDLVGTWNYFGICPYDLSLVTWAHEYSSYQECVTMLDMAMGGYGTFESGGKVIDDGEYVLTMVHDVECLSRLFGMSCERIDGGCKVEGAQCICVHKSADSSPMIDKYVVSGTAYETGYVNGKPTDRREYCIQDDVLTIFEPVYAPGGAGRMTFTRAPK
jgi:hypothetical protein